MAFTKYYHHEKIFTDGSTSDSAAGMRLGANVMEMDKLARPIFTAEAAVLHVTLSAIGKSKMRSFVISSDSLTAPRAHGMLNLRILKLKLKYNSLSFKGKSISFVWIPTRWEMMVMTWQMNSSKRLYRPT